MVFIKNWEAFSKLTAPHSRCVFYRTQAFDFTWFPHLPAYPILLDKISLVITTSLRHRL